MSNISIRFKHNAGDQIDGEIILNNINPYTTTCKQLIKEFCSKTKTPFKIETDKITFLFNGKTLNEKEFLDLYLSDKKVNLTKDRKQILVKEMEHLIGQKI